MVDRLETSFSDINKGLLQKPRPEWLLDLLDLSGDAEPKTSADAQGSVPQDLPRSFSVYHLLVDCCYSVPHHRIMKRGGVHCYDTNWHRSCVCQDYFKGEMPDGTPLVVKYRPDRHPILSLRLGNIQVAQVTIGWFPSIQEANKTMTKLAEACMSGQSKGDIAGLRKTLLTAAGITAKRPYQKGEGEPADTPPKLLKRQVIKRPAAQVPEGKKGKRPAAQAPEGNQGNSDVTAIGDVSDSVLDDSGPPVSLGEDVTCLPNFMGARLA